MLVFGHRKHVALSRSTCQPILLADRTWNRKKFKKEAAQAQEHVVKYFFAYIFYRRIYFSITICLKFKCVRTAVISSYLIKFWCLIFTTTAEWFDNVTTNRLVACSRLECRKFLKLLNKCF